MARAFPHLRQTAIGALAALGILLAAGAPDARAGADDADACAAEIAKAERRFDIPGQLLMAVALVESGRWIEDAARLVAWPWTVYAQGRGRYFASAADAAAEVARLRARGVRNIDVGCMQVNLAHHPEAFASIEDSFDPALNVGYGAAFLAQLYASQRSWARAVASYHSTTPEFARPYRKKVIRMWNQERRRAAEARRLKRLDELRARQAEQERARQRQRDS